MRICPVIQLRPGNAELSSATPERNIGDENNLPETIQANTHFQSHSLMVEVDILGMDEKTPSFSLDILLNPFWSMPPEEVFRDLGSSSEGLSDEEALRRIPRFGKNSLESSPRLRKTKIFLINSKAPLFLFFSLPAGLPQFSENLWKRGLFSLRFS